MHGYKKPLKSRKATKGQSIVIWQLRMSYEILAFIQFKHNSYAVAQNYWYLIWEALGFNKRKDPSKQRL